MECKKYIMVVDYPSNGNTKLWYYDSIGEMLDEIKAWIIEDDEDHDLLSVDDDLVKERLDEMEITFSMYEYGKEDPFSEIGHNGDFYPGETDRFSEWIDEMISIEEGNNVMKYNQFVNEGKKDKFPNIKKLEIDGFVIYIGRDALSNDHLTFNMSHPEDIWMHAKGVPGSHVVIRVRENLPTRETLKKVAQLVAKNSKSKSDKTTVVYCQTKFVKKEKGMNPGQVKVDYVNAEEITIEN